jgi:hypothetical protein
MSPPLRQTPDGRDAAIRRLRRVNRSLIAVAIAGAAVITEVAAHAFPGHTVKRLAGSATVVSATTPTTKTAADHHHRRTRAKPLKAAATPPTSVSQSTDTTPAQTTPPPVAAVPAPVVSGGS